MRKEALFLVLIFCVAVPFAAAVNNYTGIYEFENSLQDDSGDGNNLSSAGTGTFNTSVFKTGAYSRSYNANGNTDTNTLPAFFTNNFTIAFWMRIGGVTASNIPVIGNAGGAGASSGEWHIRSTVATNQTIFRVAGTTVFQSTTKTFGDGQWHRIVVTRNNTHLAMYVDGFLNGTNTTLATTNFTLPNITMGQISTWPTGGNLDQIIFIQGSWWNQNQITADYNSGNGAYPICPNVLCIVAYNEQNGALVSNLTSTIANATITRIINSATNTIYDYTANTNNYTVTMSDLPGLYGSRRLTIENPTNGTPRAFYLPLLSTGGNTVMTTRDGLTTVIIQGATIKQYKTISGNTILVDEKDTDFSGSAQFSYTNNQAYDFRVTAVGYTGKNFTLNPVIYSTYDVLLSSTTGGGSAANWITRVDGNITYNTGNSVATFTYNDTTRLASGACFRAYQYTMNNRQTYNSSCLSTPNGSISLYILNTTGQYYLLQGVVTYGSSTATFSQTQRFGTTLTGEATIKFGLFILLIIELLVIIILSQKLRWMIIVGSTIPLFFSIFGLINLGVGITGPLMILGLAVAYLVGGDP